MGVRPMGGAGGGPEATFGGEVELGPYDMEIEIKGIIYIYNLPDPTKVGMGVAAAGQVPGTDGKQPDPAEKAAEKSADKAPADPAGKAPVDPSGKTPEEKLPMAKGAGDNTPAKAGPENGKQGPSPAPAEKAADPLGKEPAALPPAEPGKTPAAKS
jgi:hypothetical protein